MQISEARKLKTELEQDITDSIRRLVNTFENRSGIQIDALHFNADDVTTCKDIKLRLRYGVDVCIKL